MLNCLLPFYIPTVSELPNKIKETMDPIKSSKYLYIKWNLY